MEQNIQQLGRFRLRFMCGKGLWVAVGLLLVAGLTGLIVTLNSGQNSAAGAVAGITTVLVLSLIGLNYWLCKYKDNETLQFLAGWRTLQGK